MEKKQNNEARWNLKSLSGSSIRDARLGLVHFLINSTSLELLYQPWAFTASLLTHLSNPSWDDSYFLPRDSKGGEDYQDANHQQ